MKHVPDWQLSALGLTNPATARKVERNLKRQSNVSRYCPLCFENAKQIPGCTMVALELLPFKATSEALRHTMLSPTITIEASEGKNADDLAKIQLLMHSEGDALGFIPVSKNFDDHGINRIYSMGQVILARDSETIIGYLAYTCHIAKKWTRIHQIIVDDKYRNRGIATEMLALLQKNTSNIPQTCWVRDDLPANDFWTKSGFTLQQRKQHPTSHSILNYYRKDI
jgi:N-acetylglutamate synthase-like GNAT family acetyltransferase